MTWRDRSLADLLAANGLSDVVEEPLPTDGWSGAAFARLRPSAGRAYVLKRDSLARDWIARATGDTGMREAALVSRLVDRPAVARFPAGGPLRFPHLGAAADGDDAVVLMLDLSAELLAWERPGHEPRPDAAVVEGVIDAIAMLHTGAWWLAVGDEPGLPWCPLPERLSLLSRPAAVGYAAAGNPVGERFLAGWDAFDRLAPASTRGLVDRLAADPARLVAALAGLPSIGLHGDLKLANVAVFPDGGIGLIDWQMVGLGPTALELGWLLVSNSAVLPLEPMEVLRRYRDSVGRYVGRRGVAEGAPRTLEEVIGEPATHDDLAIIVGLVLRGWRKGLDAEAGLTLPAGVTAVDDLAWWSRRAVEAAERRLA